MMAEDVRALISRRTKVREAESLSGLVDSIADATSQLAREESMVLFERSTLQDRLLSTEQKKRDLELNLRREEDISAALQVNIDDLTAREVHLMDERDLTKRELVDVLRKLKEAHEAVADAQQEAAMAQSDRDTMRITLSEAQERHSSALMDVTHATAVAQQKERKIASLEASQKQMQEEIEAAADAAATSHTQYIELQRTASEQTRKNEVLTDELEATSAAGVILRKELSELRHLAVEQRGVVMAAKADTDKAKEEKEHTERKNEHLLQSQKALEAELEEARTALLAESEKARETRKALMDETTALAGSKDVVRGLEAQLTKSKTEAVAAEEELRAVIGRLQSSREDLKVESEALHRKLHSQEREKAHLGDLIEAEKRTVSTLTARVSTLEGAEAAAAKVEQEVLALKAEAAHAQRTLQTTEAKLEAANLSTRDLQENLAKVREEHAGAEATAARCASAAAQSATQKDAEMAKLSSYLADVKKGKASLEKQYAALTVELKRTKDEVSTLGRTLASVQARNKLEVARADALAETGQRKRDDRVRAALTACFATARRSARRGFRRLEIFAAVSAARREAQRQHDATVAACRADHESRLADVKKASAATLAEAIGRADAERAALSEEKAEADRAHARALSAVEERCKAEVASAKVAALELEAGLALARVEGKQALEAANDAASAQITELSRSLQAKVDRYEEESGARSVAHDRRVMVRALHRMCDRRRHLRDAWQQWRIGATDARAAAAAAKEAAAMEAASAAKVCDLRSRFSSEAEDLRAARDRSRADATISAEGLARKSEALAAEQGLVAAAKKREDELVKELSNAATALQGKDTALREAASAAAVETEERLRLVNELENLQRALADEQAECRGLRSIKHDLVSTLDEISSRLDSTNTALENAKVMKRDLSVQLLATQSDLTRVSSELTKEQQSNRRKESDLQHTRKEIQKLHVVCDARKVEIEEKSRTIQALEMKQWGLRDELQNAEASHSEQEHNFRAAQEALQEERAALERQRDDAARKSVQGVIRRMLLSRPARGAWMRWRSATRSVAAAAEASKTAAQREAAAVAAVEGRMADLVRAKRAARDSQRAKLSSARAFLKWHERSAFIATLEAVQKEQQLEIASAAERCTQEVNGAAKIWAEKVTVLEAQVNQLDTQCERGVEKAAELSEALRCSHEAQTDMASQLSHHLLEKDVAVKELEAARLKVRRLVEHLGEIQRRLTSWGLDPTAFLVASEVNHQRHKARRSPVGDRNAGRQPHLMHKTSKKESKKKEKKRSQEDERM